MLYDHLTLLDVKPRHFVHIEVDPFLVFPGGQLHVCLRCDPQLAELMGPFPSAADKGIFFSVQILDRADKPAQQQLCYLSTLPGGGATVVFEIPESAHPDRYRVRVVLNETNLSNVAAFYLVKANTVSQLERFNAALRDRTQASHLIQENDYVAAADPLRNAAETYTSLGCFSCSVIAWRDLATLYLSLQQQHAARDAARRMLLSYAAHDFQLPTQDGLEQSVIPQGHLDLGRSIGSIPDLLIACGIFKPFPTENPVRFSVLFSLAALEDRSDLFKQLLTTQISDPEYTALCFETLVEITPECAADFLPLITEVAIGHLGIERYTSLLSSVFAKANPVRIYDNLASVLDRMSSAAQMLFLDVFVRLFPVVFANDFCYISSADDRVLGRIRNSDELIRLLRREIGSRSFDELRAAVEVLVA